MALPIAILISSVMLMGNLAERYELASIKSAGVPLIRTMVPLMFICAAIGGFSFLCSNYLIPVANLKFKSRLYDIKKSRPTLSLEEKVFNDDFKGFVIHIGEKGKDKKTIKDVIISDHNSYNKGMLSEIVAESGEMYNTDDGSFFIMNLFNGRQYKESVPSGTGKDKTYPFIRTKFKEWNKVFDLGQFEMNRTDEKLFQSHQTMMSIRQLRSAIDSIDLKRKNKRIELSDYMNTYLSFRETSKKVKPKPKAIKVKNSSKAETSKTDKKSNTKSTKKTTDKKKTISKNKDTKKPVKKNRKKYTKPVPKQNIKNDLKSYSTILETFESKDRSKFISKAESTARNIHGQTQSTNRNMYVLDSKRIKHIYELYIKYSLAIVCIVFLFIGAPMGAIVRKGGFGYPLLIAIFFFIFFMVLNILFEKMAEQRVIEAMYAAWVPIFVLIPIGILLTYAAMNDRKIVNTDRFFVLLRYLKGLLSA